MALLAEWPWERIGNLKYFLYAPIMLKALHSSRYEQSNSHNWCLHILILSSLRYIQHQCWNTYSRLHCMVKKHQISQNAVDFVQVDREFHCENFILFQALVGAAVLLFVPGCQDLPIWSLSGMVSTLVVHMGVSEFLYYWAHRAFHCRPLLYSQYHSFHHLSTTPEPATAGTRTFLEELVQTSLIVVALAGSVLGGRASIVLLYVYMMGFDFLKQMGHCNCEFVPLWAFTLFPPLKFLLYTPSYHSLHHTDQSTNLCLFMPLYDYLGGTRNKNTWSLYLSLRKGSKDKVPQFVFLAHAIGIVSSTQVSFLGRTFSSVPYRLVWHQLPSAPLCFIGMLCLWIWGRTFVAYEYILRGLHAQTWVIPRYGFHYFLPFGKDRINELIEKAILDADALGVEVISLAALNKNEALNGGGLLFVEKHRDLRVRVVHGNTLTAAVILYEISPSVKEVFLTGATSKLGRAIAIYLCRKSIRVLMLTSSRERYEKILSEVPADHRSYLVQVTKYQAGQHCKTWIIGKWTNAREQRCAPPGTHFHQFVVPPVFEFRKDCTYGKLAGMHVPKDIKGLRTCEYTFERGVVAACHAGGLVHALQGWDHHEVGSIDVDRIDIVWEAARKHGFTPV